MHPVTFLSVEDVLALHQDTIEHECGDPGILNMGPVDSAVAMPRQQFGGEYLHPTLGAMAAPYLFHIAGNHGFADGNKRTGLLAALVFLRHNGVDLDVPPEELEQLAVGVASGRLSKQQVIDWFEHRLD